MKHRAKSEFDFVNYLESYKQETFLSEIYPKPPIYFSTNIHPIQNLFEPEDSPNQVQHPSVFLVVGSLQMLMWIVEMV